ncbi:hypothetical protein [Leucobacter ruminantium]|uniref:DUF4913 domain-containing protein n=1 Tax=Leucobacter ruminantium TaxID=1289170 RepID=A0A939LTD1_9MICO|nr:hypothetical protein [Leucobacter ruminantium]MBO1804460.1 hypothetical protein [Leucobacter ruminantium]
MTNHDDTREPGPGDRNDTKGLDGQSSPDAAVTEALPVISPSGLPPTAVLPVIEDDGVEEDLDDDYDPEDVPDDFGYDADPDAEDPELDTPDPPTAIHWDLLTPEAAAVEWTALNIWVHWLRKTYAVQASIIPPYWHTHTEIVWELSALHLFFLHCYHPDKDGAGPITWCVAWAAARVRLRELVTIAGTRLDRDRPTRRTYWPGEEAGDEGEEVPITNREAHFKAYVKADIQARREARVRTQEVREHAARDLHKVRSGEGGSHSSDEL